MITKRKLVAIALSPITIPFFLLWRFMEWFHFNVSGGLLRWFRNADKKIEEFFRGLA